MKMELSMSETLDDAAERAIALAESSGQEVEFDFNGVNMNTKDYSSAENLIKGYLNKTNPNKAQKEEQQAQFDAKVAQMDSLNFSEPADLLDWFCSIQDDTDTTGIIVPAKDIVRTFEDNRYFANVGIGEDTDKDASARYIIGQCLDGLAHDERVHSVVHRFTQHWKEKFNH